MTGTFAGKRGRLFGMAIRMGVLTVLTLGMYRFWMKTRLRRWYWSGVRIGGHPLEYVGDPFEKLLGFLIAVVFLAFYIGIVNLLLMFASFALLQGNFAAYALSFIGVIPLWFYAQYRARRYVLARTRWRGLRFGLEPGAWGYAWRALLHWALTLVTVGLLWPRMTFYLEKYKTDRTFFGDARMQQGGSWTMLYRSMKPLFVTAFMAALAAIAVFTDRMEAGIGLGGLATLVGIYALAHYRVDTLRRLTAHKTLQGSSLVIKARVGRVLGIHVVGYFLAAVAILIPLIVITIVIAAASSTGNFTLDMTNIANSFDGLSRGILIVISMIFYFSIFLMWSALTHVLITLPLWRHYTNELTVIHAGNLVGVSQRPRDEHTEAEGFAEALDVGAAI